MSLSATEYLAAPGAQKIERHETSITAAVETALASGSRRGIDDLPPDLAAEALRRLEARLAARDETTGRFMAANGAEVSWA